MIATTCETCGKRIFWGQETMSFRFCQSCIDRVLREVKEALSEEAPVESHVFEKCNVCGIVLRSDDEFSMGMCERCAAE